MTGTSKSLAMTRADEVRAMMRMGAPHAAACAEEPRTAGSPPGATGAARRPASPAAAVLKGCVHAYRYTLRGVIGSHCRFHPTCSDYALEALSTHGAARGSLMTAKRILRCNPWNPGGYDPVPGPIPPKG